MPPFSLIEAGVGRFELLPSAVERRGLPLNFTSDQTYLFSNELVRRIESCEVFRIESLHIAGPIWVQWKYLRSLENYKPRQGSVRQKKHRLYSSLQLLRPSIKIDQAIWIHDNWSEGYFHWLTDVCPKLMAWTKQSLPKLPVLLPFSFLSHSYVQDTLAALDFPWIGFANAAHLYVRNLFVISPVAPTGNYRADLLNEMAHIIRDYCFSKIDAGTSLPTRIWISRKDASKRYLVNEDEILSSLSGLAFSSVCLAGKTLSQQISLFAGASILVSIHGNGLTNMIWLPPGSPVIEIRRRGDYTNNCYYSLAQALGHRYYFLEADDASGTGDTHTADLWLDPNSLMGLIQQIL